MEIEEDLVPGLKGQDRFWVGVMGTTPVGHDSAEQMCYNGRMGPQCVVWVPSDLRAPLIAQLVENFTQSLTH